MKNKSERKVLVLGGNQKQVPYIKELKSRGHWVGLTDSNSSAAGANFADAFYPVKYDDMTRLKEVADDIGLSANDCVFSAASQFSQVGVSYLSNLAGISYPEICLIEACLDKSTYYPIFESSNLHIPDTKIIKNEMQLKNVVRAGEPSQSYYLKSDFSKNPNYVYQFQGKDFSDLKFFWGKDRYLRSCYILQKEFSGTHLRLNMFFDRFNIIDFKTGIALSKDQCSILSQSTDLVERLRSFLAGNGLNKLLIKFDVIVNGSDWCVLDIGLDPPSRMRRIVEAMGLSFEKYYIDQYLYGVDSYPEINL